jgi:glycosyltransferase involved in cell wall biosynthesis
VHVRNAHAILTEAGVECAVLNIEKGSPGSRPITFLSALVRYAIQGWTFHVHTNGHNRKSWLVALAAGVVAQVTPGGAALTLHSGCLPDYLRGTAGWRQRLARVACGLYDRVVCVNQELADTLFGVGVARSRLTILPAWLPARPASAEVPGEIETWLRNHRPVLSTVLFFRPEYGFELLIAAVERLRKNYPSAGCLVMGDSANAQEMREALESKGLGDAFVLLGDVDHEECLSLLSRSDVFVRATYNDGDSISVREALSLGVPVVASNVGTRPAGSFVFKAGSVDGLLACIESALNAGAIERTKESVNTVEQLMSVYVF